ncbi:TIGR03084 family metal-binding protein [Solwaraspora sp. WMMD1047]|uniref:TIGR03084 family metal-binding protein n=1 Tax=Solwaraspora sp. WMMD1047 TaxID=3016102 RepID=UPI002417ADF9|nr:TIGR03084 family metal-binding protein [Solwaraspora sp. WMMD1047]MDG4828017.1 TIGR03084 family metal-binding protein [Solwaraspora sp. WMMD1047]
MVDLDALLADLADESAELDALVAGRPATDWARPTPAPGWTVAHQIAHLHWTDQVSLQASTDLDAFLGTLSAAAADPSGFVDKGAAEVLAAAPDPTDLLTAWRAGRTALATALTGVPEGTKIPWFGVQMSPASVATGRLMETWAHGQDIADALEHERVPTGRLRHVAHLGTRTLVNGFLAHGRPAPEVPVRVELRAPDGGEWAYGPTGAADRVTGTALDFCLLVTQRRHRSDLGLVATGPVADEWLDIAQAFAGPAGAGRTATPAAG